MSLDKWSGGAKYVGQSEAHPKQEVEDAIKAAEALGWKLEERSTAVFGLLRCKANDPTCRDGTFCQQTVNRTPQNPGSHARKLLDRVKNCVRLPPPGQANATGDGR